MRKPLVIWATRHTGFPYLDLIKHEFDIVQPPELATAKHRPPTVDAMWWSITSAANGRPIRYIVLQCPQRMFYPLVVRADGIGATVLVANTDRRDVWRGTWQAHHVVHGRMCRAWWTPQAAREGVGA